MNSWIGLSPTTQSHEGYPYGDCVRASYATLLDLPVEAVPRFDPAVLTPGEAQRTRERRWLATLGLELFEISTAPKRLPDEVLNGIPEIPHLISGLSPRGFGHRCVGIGGRIAWDPHPSRAGLVRVWSVGLVLPREFQA